MVQIVFYIAVAVVLVILYWVFDRRRYLGKRGKGHSRQTGEVFRDPVSGQLVRVHEDPKTGEREYRPEP